jgi:hypothetical protein
VNKATSEPPQTIFVTSEPNPTLIPTPPPHPYKNGGNLEDSTTEEVVKALTEGRKLSKKEEDSYDAANRMR